MGRGTPRLPSRMRMRRRTSNVIILIVRTPDSLCADTLRDTITISPYSRALVVVYVDTCAYRVQLISRSLFTNSVLCLVGDTMVGRADTLWWQVPGPGIHEYQLITNPAASPICRDTLKGRFEIPERKGPDSITYQAGICGGWVQFEVFWPALAILFVASEGLIYPAGPRAWTAPLQSPHRLFYTHRLLRQ